jgi:hypothetical protein
MVESARIGYLRGRRRKLERHQYAIEAETRARVRRNATAPAKKSSLPIYPYPFTYHSVQQVNSSGSFITLEDDSAWEISDRGPVSTWLPGEDIFVDARNIEGSTLYHLINTDANNREYALESSNRVYAHYLGRIVTRSRIGGH